MQTRDQSGSLAPTIGDVVGMDSAFEAFLEWTLTRDDAKSLRKENVERVARRAFYGVHYDRLFPDTPDDAGPQEDDGEIDRRFGLRIAPSQLEEGLDLVAAFAHEYPGARRRYCVVTESE